MEPSVIIFKIDKEIKFKKADLEELKDSEYGDVESDDNKICKFLNVAYCLNIYPNGSEEEESGQTWLFFNVELRGALKVQSNIKCCVESENSSINVNKVFQDSEVGWGTQLCTTKNLFDLTKKFFVIDEMIIKIKGTMKIYLPSNKIIYPISAKWSINKKKLENIKNSVDENENYVTTEEFQCSYHTDIKYDLSFYPNGDSNDRRGKAWMFLEMEFGTDVSKIEAFYNISINSAIFSEDLEYVFEKAEGYGIDVCSTLELFNPENQYFDDEDNMVIYVNGILMIDREKPKLECQEDIFMKDIQTDDEKDFTIIVGEKNIKVHKQLLLDSSPYFIGLFNSGMIESIEMNTTITDFDYEIVEAGIKILYDPRIPSNFSFEKMLELLRFSDKYDIQIIKDLVENHLIENISPTNVCLSINFTSSIVSAPKLYSKCIQFLVKCSEEKKAIYLLETLDKDLMTYLFMQSFIKNFST